MKRPRAPRILGTFRGHAVTEGKVSALRALVAAGEAGACSAPVGALSGGQLAALVQIGLAERMPADRLGGQRYRANAAGAAFLEDLDGALGDGGEHG